MVASNCGTCVRMAMQAQRKDNRKRAPLFLTRLRTTMRHERAGGDSFCDATRHPERPSSSVAHCVRTLTLRRAIAIAIPASPAALQGAMFPTPAARPTGARCCARTTFPMLGCSHALLRSCKPGSEHMEGVRVWATAKARHQAAMTGARVRIGRALCWSDLAASPHNGSRCFPCGARGSEVTAL